MRDLARMAIAAFGRREEGSGVLGVDVQRIRRALGLRAEGLEVSRPGEEAIREGLPREALRRFEALLRADLRHSQRRGEIFAPMHWTDQFASIGPVGRVVSALVDPVSGQPELKATAASVTAEPVYFHGLLLRRQGGALPDLCHWVRVPLTEGQLYRLAGLCALPAGEDLARFAAALLDPPAGANDPPWENMAATPDGFLS